MSTCHNCGGDESIHHFEDQRCPIGGREQRPHSQVWMSSIFRPAEDDTMRRRVLTLETMVGDLLARIKVLEAPTRTVYPAPRVNHFPGSPGYSLLGHAEDCPGRPGCKGFCVPPCPACKHTVKVKRGKDHLGRVIHICTEESLGFKPKKKALRGKGSMAHLCKCNHELDDHDSGAGLCRHSVGKTGRRCACRDFRGRP